MIKPSLRVFTLCVLPLPLLLGACDRHPEPRRYSEIATRGENSGLQAAPHSLDWTLPEGWSVQPEGDPLRLTGFWAPDPERVARDGADPDPVDVSLVRLSGDAGGLEANVVRWLGQVGIPASSAAQVLREATPVRLASGEEGVLVDFTGFLSGDLTQSKSIVGAIVPVDGGTLFVKAMGPRASVARVKPQVEAFCRGLSVGGDAGAEESP